MPPEVTRSLPRGQPVSEHEFCEETRLKKRTFLGSTLLAVLAAIVAGGVGGVLPAWLQVRTEVRLMVDRHLDYRVAHPGWSFPATVWSAPVPLDVPPERLHRAAERRGYRERCPAEEPGEYCPENGAVVPRGGWFPEGWQPGGWYGWSRPVALEPVAVGTLLGPDAEVRFHLPLDRAPEHLVAAIIVAEDEAFREHRGVDLPGIARAAWANVTGGGYRQGASTLTMQAIRNLSQRKEKTLRRKLWEAAAALAMERYVGKEGVLQVYLDAPYLGQAGNLSICGFEAAARYYWGISAQDLTLAQAATLAAILPAPGAYSPLSHPERARTRRDALLHRMEERGWEVEAALNAPLGASPHPVLEERHPAYVQAVRAHILRHFPEGTVYGGGLQVFTALDLPAQEQGERLFPETLAWYEELLGHREEQPLLAAAALLDPATGHLVAVFDGSVGLSTDFSRVTQARRQPGSSFKPVIYALAMSRTDEEGRPLYTAATPIPNERRVFPGTDGWMPRNISGEYSPTSCLAMALAWSQNVATAGLLEMLGGPEALLPFARKLGFDVEPWPHEMGLALGQGEVTVLEMGRFVSTVVRGGTLASGSPVTRVLDLREEERWRPPTARRVLTPEAAAITRELMRLVIEYGTGGRSRGTGGKPGYGGLALGKTGTTDGERDVWFVGSTPHYTGALWIGYDEPARIGATASDLAAPLWGWWMRALHEHLPPADFEGPEVIRYPICTVTGLRGNDTCQLIPAPFLPGTVPRGTCPEEHDPAPPPHLAHQATDEHAWTSLWDRLSEEESTEEESTEEQPGTDAPTQEEPVPSAIRSLPGTGPL